MQCCGSGSVCFWTYRIRIWILPSSSKKSIVADPGPNFSHPGSRIPDQNFSFPDPGSTSKILGIVTQKKFLSSRKYDQGCSSRIPDTSPGSGSRTRIRILMIQVPIPDSGSKGVKKAPPPPKYRNTENSKKTLISTVRYVTDEKSKIRSRIRILESVARIRGSRSVTKCHGSTTLTRRYIIDNDKVLVGHEKSRLKIKCPHDGFQWLS